MQTHIWIIPLNGYTIGIFCFLAVLLWTAIIFLSEEAGDRAVTKKEALEKERQIKN